MKRLILDISTLARWTGPPVGMIRAESELYRAASAMGLPMEPAFFDPSRAAFRRLNPAYAAKVLGWHGTIDCYGIDYVLRRQGWRRSLPSRLAIVQWLERRRLTSGSPLIQRAADLLQRAVLMVRRHTFPFQTGDGMRVAFVPHDLALAESFNPGPEDTILSASSDWQWKDPAAIAALKHRTGCRIAVVCYDIIPITHPCFFPPDDAATFRRYWDAMFSIADTVIVNAGPIRDDIVRYRNAAGAPVPSIAVVPLGCQPSTLAGRVASLPSGLQTDRFVLFVSTIEPRKNHALLLDVWTRLLARDLVRKAGFRLVFVGRPGWMTDDVLDRIGHMGDSVLHLRNAGDDVLWALCAGAAFCVYPSIYEGFGLPVVEAFALGKAVIASNGGALKDVAGAVVETLDPTDIDAWEAAMAAMMRDPSARRACEARVRERYRPVSWHDAAAAMLAESGFNGRDSLDPPR